MPTAIQTPLNEGDAQKVGKRLFRKQVLPVGEVEHDGHTLQFTKPYLEKLAANFSAGAMDQVPFVLVDEKNKHTDDPERVRGDLAGVEVQDDGLYALVEMSEKGAELIKDNPKLGVSARIDQENMVLKHVAGTIDPVAKGMKPWEALNLSKPDEGTTLIDLTDSKFAVPSDPAHSSDPVSTDAPLSPEELAAFRKILAKDGKGGSGKPTDDDVIDTLVRSAEEPVALSAEAQRTIDLAKSQAEEAKQAADAAQDQVAKANWEKDRAAYEQAGVPPYMLDLAEPHLSKASTVIELSKSDSQASAMRKMLEESKGMVDLSERGRTTASESEEEEARKIAEDEKVWS